MQSPGVSKGPDVQLLLKILLELEEQLSRDEPFAPVCAAFLQQLMNSMGMRRCALLMFEPKDNQLNMRVNLGVDSRSLQFAVDPPTFQNLLARRHHILHLTDPPPELEAFLRRNRAQVATLATPFWVPVRAKNALLGYLAVGPKRNASAYTAAEYHMLRLISQMLGFTLYNEILLESIKNRNQDRLRLQRENKALRGLSISLTAVSDLTRLMQLILQQACKMLQTREGMIVTLSKDSPFLKIAAHTGLPETELKRMHLPANSPALTVGFSQEEGIFMETAAEPRLNGLFRHPQLLTAPLRINRSPYGLILLGERVANAPAPRYGPAERQFLSLFARHAALSIQNFLLHRSMQEQKNFLNKLLHRLPLGIASINPAGQIDFANALFAKMCGRAVEELSGKHYQELFNREPGVVSLIEQAAAIGKGLRKAHYTPRGNFPGATRLQLTAIPTAPPGRVILSAENIPPEENSGAAETGWMRPETVRHLRRLDQSSPTGQYRPASVAVIALQNLPTLLRDILPEQLPQMLNPYLQALQSLVLEFGGILRLLSPEEVVIIFGPGEEGHQPARITAFLERLLHTLPRITRVQLAGQTHALEPGIGVASGPLQWGLPEGQPPWFLGESLHHARDLAAAAGSGEILVCPTTRELLGGPAEMWQPLYPNAKKEDTGAPTAFSLKIGPPTKQGR